jgi:hypothetical protein
MGFNSAFKGLNIKIVCLYFYISYPERKTPVSYCTVIHDLSGYTIFFHIIA